MAKRRLQGNGSIRKLTSGKWQGQIMDGYKENGKRNIVSFVAKTKGEVQDKMCDYWIQKELQGEGFTRNTSFTSWADTWYSDYESEVEASTYSNYKYTLRILKEGFANRTISDIKALDVNRFLDSLKSKNYSKSLISKCRAMLIQIFDYAEANQLTLFNPARKAKRLRDKGNSKLQSVAKNEKDAFTVAEQAIIKNNLPKDMMGHSIRLLLGSGMRVQELLALKPEDVKEDGSTIKISKSIKMVDGIPTLGPPKSNRGNRIIPIPNEYRDDAIFLRMHSGKPYIWTSRRENGLYDIGTFRRHYYRELKRLTGVRSLSPHCCRHTYISNLEKKGIPLEQISFLVGHSDASMTIRYVHFDAETLANAVSVLDNY